MTLVVVVDVLVVDHFVVVVVVTSPLMLVNEPNFVYREGAICIVPLELTALSRTT